MDLLGVAATQVRTVIGAITDAVRFAGSASRWLTLHAAEVTFTADQRACPADAITDGKRSAAPILIESGSEQFDAAHSFMAEHDGQRHG